jgi:hypothetical protein
MSILSSRSLLASEGPAATGDLNWISAGFTLFVFAAPSAAQSAPFFIGGTGYLGGTLFCILNTAGAIAGSWMLLQVKFAYPSAHTFGDLGDKVFGFWGRVIGNFIQIGNFILFLPCALKFTSQALQGIKDWPFPFTQHSGAPCWDYYIFVIALICFATTQARTLNNTAIFALLSLISVFMMAVIQIVAAYSYDVTDKKEALYFGNPDPEISTLLMFRGASICVFGYVPSFLTAELATCMKSPSEMTKSLVLSGVLNLVLMLGVGIPVVARWGYNQGYVAPLTGQFAGPGTAQVTAWNMGQTTTIILQVFALTGNFVSYMLDSVPLGKFCQVAWAPGFKNTWSCGDITRYAGYTLPSFLFGLFMAIFFPSLDFLIDMVTIFTTPWVTMVYPAALYLKLFSGGDPSALTTEPRKPMSSETRIFVVGVLALGLVGVFISTWAGVGNFIHTGTSEWQIGCEGWEILKPDE